MARKNTSSNGHTRLEDALAQLVQNQAAFIAQLADSDRRHAENERRYLELKEKTDARYLELKEKTDARYLELKEKTDARFEEIIRILNNHTRVLERLPEAVREKIGFKG